LFGGGPDPPGYAHAVSGLMEISEENVFPRTMTMKTLNLEEEKFYAY